MVFGIKLGLPNKKQPAEPPPGTGPSHVSKGGAGAGGGGGKGALTVNEFVARSRRQRERGLEPTKPELIAYARYLGIDPIADGDLMWISDEALNAPLPSEWTEHHDSSDRVFYYNVQTHSSSWTHPLEQLHRDTYKGIVNFRSGDMSKEDQAAELDRLRRRCEESEREAHKELQAWTEHTDEQGQKFYYNREHQRSVWTDPRPARCHTLYLQMKALRVLSNHCGQSVAINFDKPTLGSLERHGGHSGRAKGNNGMSEDDRADAVDKERSRRKKKNKHKDDKDDAMEPASQGQGLGLGSLGPLPGGLGKVQNSMLDAKKPTAISAVDEVRQTLGLGPGGLPPMGPLSGRSHFGARDRLGTPPGDGLATVGRVKVRAGIKLEPLR